MTFKQSIPASRWAFAATREQFGRNFASTTTAGDDLQPAHLCQLASRPLSPLTTAA